MGFNEFVFVVDTPADVRSPRGAGLHLHSVQISSEGKHRPADKQRGRDGNAYMAPTILIINAH